MAEITFRDLKNLGSFKNLPILTLDQRWYQLMPEFCKTDEVRYWERRVNDLLKKQSQVTGDLKDVEELKGKLMSGIIRNMDESDEKKHKKRMQQSQRLIFEAKDKIEKLRGKAEDVPTQLQRANQKLMIETVKACYNIINENDKELEVLDEWIEKTRVLLKKNLLIRHDKEEINNNIYGGMHAIFGTELMGKMDRINEGYYEDGIDAYKERHGLRHRGKHKNQNEDMDANQIQQEQTEDNSRRVNDAEQDKEVLNVQKNAYNENYSD